MSNFTRITLPRRGSSVLRKLLSVIFWAPATVFLSAWSFQDGEEKVTVKGDNVPLITVFKTIKKQTGYSFFYAADYVNDQKKVSLDVKNTRVEDVLRRVLGGDYVWVYNENAVSITKKKEEVRRSSLASVFVPDSSVTQITVSGSVIDAKGTPIPGATVMVKGTRDGASTDENGRFSLPAVAPNAVLVVSSVGFERREILVKGRTILAQLNLSVNDLDEAVVVAYNTTTQRANTGAVTVVNGEDIRNLPNRSVDKSLQGLVPGLLVTSGNGQPGGGLSNFVLRGIATGGDALSGSTVRNPLIVVDGVPVSQESPSWANSLIGTPVINPMAQLNPSDIESISVLKDAAAIALYGSKASNGVILITTKKGKTGKTIFSFRHQTDLSKRLKGKVKLLNQNEYLDLVYETYKNTNPALWTEQAIRNDLYSKFPYRVNGTDTSFYGDVSWEDELYTNNAATIANELSISGGSAKSSFYINLEFTKQAGVFKKTGYDRKSIRFNFENRSIDWLKIGMSTTLSYNMQDYASMNGSDFPVGLATYNTPLNPIRLDDGTYIWNFSYPRLVANPVAAIEYNTNRNTGYRGLSKVSVEATFLKYFKLASSFGVDFMLLEGKEKFDPRLYDDVTYSIGSGRITERSTRNANLISTNTLRFDRAIKRDHALNVLIGQEAQIMTQKYLMAQVTDLILPDYNQISGSGNTLTGEGSASKQTLLSYFGQVNYAFRNKYFLSGSVRTDGSSRFGDRQRFGTFWSTGVGWILTEEPFIKRINSWVNYLKIRGSIGTAGNSAAVDASTRYDLLDPSIYMNNSAPTPINTPSNPDIKWEQTFTCDAGIETRFWNERLTLTADVYKRKTSDVIYITNLPLSTGYFSVLDNIGNIENKGVEISLSIDVVKGRNLSWNLNANWSANKNILVKANVPLATIIGGTLGNEEGRNFNSFYLVQWAGVNPANGVSQWLDAEGKVTSDYPSGRANRRFVGKPQPDGFGSITNTITFKNVQLSALLYYQYGFQIYNSDGLINDGLSPYMNQDKRALDRWQKYGDMATNPKRVLDNPNYNHYSTRYLFDGDFIRLQNVTLSYSFSQGIIDDLHIAALKIYAQAHNLKLWTKFPGEDVSNANLQGSTSLAYPNQSSFSFGINLNF